MDPGGLRGDCLCGSASNHDTVTPALPLFPQDILLGIAVTLASVLGPSGWQGTDTQSGYLN